MVRDGNNLDGLRLVGAVLVIVGHAYVLLGRVPAGEEPSAAGYTLNVLGVIIFFAISGYLIAASWNSTRDPVGYLAARCLRIFPALALVVLATAFVLGPIASARSLSGYFGDPSVWRYLQNLGLYHTNHLPGILNDLPYSASINGSLWTLPMEFACYLLVPLLVVRRWGVRVPLLLAATVLLVWISTQEPSEWARIWGFSSVRFAHYAGFFMAGALVRAGVERWGQRFLRADVATAAAALHLLGIAVLGGGSAPYLSTFLLPYVVLVIGLARTPYLCRASRFGDLSYGVYLWGWPVQQLVVLWLGELRMSANLVIVLSISALLAYASWHVVERRSMALKDRFHSLRSRRGPAFRHATGPGTAESADTSDERR